MAFTFDAYSSIQVASSVMVTSFITYAVIEFAPTDYQHPAIL